MGAFLFCILTIFATITAVLAYSAGKNNGLSDKLSRLYIAVAINSSIWSVCFGAILVQTNTEIGYFLRCIGMIGTFACLIASTYLVAEWSGIGKKTKFIVKAFSLLGIVIFPFNIRRDYIEFMISDIGMSYNFKPNFWTDMYMLYSIVIALVLFAMVIWMIKTSTKRRIKVTGKRLLISLIVITLGMLFDTILPAFGITAVPTSSLGQALCVFLVYTSLNFDKKNHIDIGNIGNYIDNSSEVYVLAYDEELRLNLASNSATEFLNLVPEKKYMIYDLFDLDKSCYHLSEESMRFDATCAQNGIPCNLGIEIIRDDFKDIIGYVALVTDMTEKTAYIREIEEARKNADRANKSKSAFLASMSHEIRTPLNAVIGMDEMIMRENDLEEIHKYAGNIMDAGKSLLAIIDDILDFSKIESGMMTIIEADYDYSQAVRELYSIVTFRAKKKGLELTFNVDENIPKRLHGDELRIRQILINIINNAVKYTKVGWIKVNMSYQLIDEENIMLIASVEDTGVGIKKEDIPKLFEKFKRLDEDINHRVEGTGLGLSIVYGLLEMMGGEIDVKSVYQRGSIFTVKIPQRVVDKSNVGRFDLEYSGVHKEYKESFRAPNAKLLAVDDNQINLRIVKGLLKTTGLKIDMATNGFDCLDMVKKEKYDIILLDHMMPEIDGIEVLKRFKSMAENLSKNAPVIALTANAMVGARDEYIGYGFDDYIAKPIDSKELENIIQQYLPDDLIQS